MAMNLLSNIPPKKDSRALWQHFSKTYMSLRVGLFLLAFSIPFVLILYGKFRHGIDFQPSMSAYFWAADKHQCATFPMRTVFVGYLYAIGVALLVYRGLTNRESLLLSAAAVCAFVVATYPERLSPEEAATDPRVAQLFENCPAVAAWAAEPALPIHFIFAAILFVLLAIVAWSCAKNSLEYLPPEHSRKWFTITYKSISIAMLLFPFVGFAVAFVFGLWSNKIFIIEALGALTFGVYWSVKTYELSLSGLERDPSEALQHVEHQHSTEEETE